ncbi:hypothetical protein K456DRAFT_385636 [Colletotrichum gloeosporioides 23]|nr:hypothetical protein K456DRAFT_385636 [Colletotrichum gloeosporioides 23]
MAIAERRRSRSRSRSRKNIRSEIKALEAELHARKHGRAHSHGRELVRAEQMPDGAVVLFEEKVEKVEEPRRGVRIEKDKKGPPPKLMRAMLATLTEYHTRRATDLIYEETDHFCCIYLYRNLGSGMAMSYYYYYPIEKKDNRFGILDRIHVYEYGTFGGEPTPGRLRLREGLTGFSLRPGG